MVTTTPGGAGQQAGGGSAQTLPPPKEVPSKIYLESYLETVTSLPAEVQRILCTLKDIDIRSQELEVESQTKTARCLEIPPQTSRNATEEQKKELAVLREDLDKIHTNLLMLADEKVELTNTAYDLLGGHIELLDEELVKFESEITMNTAQQELQQLHQQQADVLAHREKAPIASAVTPSGREDYIKQGDAVAARVSAIGAPDEWILARVMNISSDMSTYTVLDEDAEAQGSSSIHHLQSKQIIRLPKIKERKNATNFAEGLEVLALFTDTTMFYRSYVVNPARWQGKNASWGPYTLVFDDDPDPENRGYNTNRSVPFNFVVPLPKDFKHPK